MSFQRYTCPNTGAVVIVQADNERLLVACEDEQFVVHEIPIGLIHRALEREGYRVVIEKVGHEPKHG